MSAVYEVRLTPIEPILFGDNRSARAGEDHVILDQDPSPHTIYGAIGAFFAACYGVGIDKTRWDGEEDLKECLGEFEENIENGSSERSELLGYYWEDVNFCPWFPKPQHLRLRQRFQDVTISKSIELKRIKPDLASSSLKEFDHYLCSEPDSFEKELDNLINEKALKETFCGLDLSNKSLEREGYEHLPVDQIYKMEHRSGLGMDYSLNQALEGRLFSRPYRRFRTALNLDSGEWRSVSIKAYFRTLKPADQEKISGNPIAFLGGDRSRVLIDLRQLTSTNPLDGLCQTVKAAVKEASGFFCYLLTPAVREASWPLIEGQLPVAAAIGKEITISGWNSNKQKQHPRPIRRLIPAGSVLFYKWPDGDTEVKRKKLVEDYWLQPITCKTTDRFRNSGFGRMLIGVWNDGN